MWAFGKRLRLLRGLESSLEHGEYYPPPWISLVHLKQPLFDHFLASALPALFSPTFSASFLALLSIFRFTLKVSSTPLASSEDWRGCVHPPLAVSRCPFANQASTPPPLSPTFDILTPPIYVRPRELRQGGLSQAPSLPSNLVPFVGQCLLAGFTIACNWEGVFAVDIAAGSSEWVLRGFWERNRSLRRDP
ncbi:hypothetical protein NMY22_g13835 [Coprinellus aureogranulatus]|nr:hypothetical protein NMY22_g13835 [Coprinellus aureogranulatus]